MSRSHRSLTHETFKTPRISVYLVVGERLSHVLPSRNRRNLDDTLPTLFGWWDTPDRAHRGQKNSSKYTLIDGKLLRHGFTHPILVCVSGDQCMRIMEELHEGICGSHIDGQSLSSKAIRAGYYWSTMREDFTGMHSGASSASNTLIGTRRLQKS